MPERIVILSDLHLGRPHCAASNAEALRPLWQGADHLIINGDVAEIHHPRHWTIAARETMRLFDFCERDGVELTLLSGNHDPFISDIRHLSIARGHVFVTHGDVLHPAVAPWSPASGRIRQANEAALAALPAESRGHLEARLSASQHASWMEWATVERLADEAAHSTVVGMLIRPWALVKVLHYWRRIPRLAADFAAEHAPLARFVIIGHTHRPGIWTIDGRVIVNTGSYGFPGRPLAVVIEGERLSVVDIRDVDGVYGLHDRARATFTLPEASIHTGQDAA